MASRALSRARRARHQYRPPDARRARQRSALRHAHERHRQLRRADREALRDRLPQVPLERARRRTAAQRTGLQRLQAAGRESGAARALLECAMRAFLLCLLIVPLIAAGQYPSKPVRLIVTYPPGGGADTIARLLAPRVGEALGQPMIVENRPGASGTIGAGEVARAAPDGMTLMLDASSYAVNPALYPKLPYDPRRAFAPISLLVLFPNMLVVNPAFAARSVQELVPTATAQPGKIAYASSGNGSAQHLAAELFRQGAGLDMVHVPYKGGGPALQDVIGGQVPLFFANMASGLPHVKSGRLRALAVTGSRRSGAAPELPTLAESGVPG